MDSLLKTVIVILHDQSWTAIGVLLGICVAFFEVLRLSNKTLAYRVIRDEAKPHLQHSTARCVTWKLKNCGNEYIMVENYNNSPIELTFGQNAQVLDVLKTKTAEHMMPLDVNKQTDKVVLKPFLLNPKQWIELQCWVVHMDSVDLMMHITGGKMINVDDYCRQSVARARVLQNLALICFLLWLAAMLIHIQYPNRSIMYTITSIFAILIYLLASVSIFLYFWAKLKYR